MALPTASAKGFLRPGICHRLVNIQHASRKTPAKKPVHVIVEQPPPPPHLHEMQLRPPREDSLKTISRIKNKDGSITIEGRAATSISQRPVIDVKKGACTLCSLNLDVQYTDVLILRQFLRKDGQLLPRSDTGLCAKQQRKMDMMVHKAHNAGLLDCLQPPLPDGKFRRPKKESKFKFRGLNRYFTDDY